MNKKFTEQDMQNYADYVAKALLSNIKPDLAFWYAEWHKTAKKVIDLSVLIESGIDCEFKDDFSERITIGKLESVYDGPHSDEYPYKTSTSRVDGYGQCQPRMNHIHAWQGGDCPLPEGFKVKVWVRGDRNAKLLGYVANWNHSTTDKYYDIIAFEVLGLADGYVMPWESE